MNSKINDFQLELHIEYLTPVGGWAELPARGNAHGQYLLEAKGITGNLRLTQRGASTDYKLDIAAEFDMRVWLRLCVPDCRDPFHLIPCNIHGDNNLAVTGPGEYPHLTDQYADDPFCAPLWEYRADRAALPNQFGVSLSYGNDPGSFIDKRKLLPSTAHTFRRASVRGRIFAVAGDRRGAHRIIRELYREHRIVPEYTRDAVNGMMDAWLNLNWGPVSDWNGEDYYRNVRFPHDGKPPWSGRPLIECGWTAGGVMLYPFALARHILGRST